MKIIQTKDQSLRKQIRQKLKENNGYCPCKLQHTAENLCICQQFHDGPLGPCHCGLYIKVQE